MATSEEKHSCCTRERKRLMRDLRSCDFCSTSYEEHQRCYEGAASISGDRSRACMTAL